MKTIRNLITEACSTVKKFQQTQHLKKVNNNNQIPDESMYLGDNDAQVDESLQVFATCMLPSKKQQPKLSKFEKFLSLFY